MRSRGAVPCGALSLALGALLGAVTEAGGTVTGLQSFSSPPPYLPVTFRVLRAETSFFLRESRTDAPRNASLQARVQSFFPFRARRPPVLSASYGPFSVEQTVPLDLLAPSSFPGPWASPSLGWQLRAHVLQTHIYRSRPRVQVLFHALGRDWARSRTPGTELPCLQVFAFQETRAVQASCQLAGKLGLCVAQLELPDAWFSPPTAPAGRKKPVLATPPEGSSVELYYSLQASEPQRGCQGEEVNVGQLDGATTHLQRLGTIQLSLGLESIRFRELDLDENVAIWLPARPARRGDVVTASITISSNATVDLFVLRVKVKKGVTILGTRASEPQQWDIRQELGDSGTHSSISVVCQRLAPGDPNRSSGQPSVVGSVGPEISGASPAGSQPVRWQVEYPHAGGTQLAVADIIVSHKDLEAIVPLPQDSELLNTAVLTGRAVVLPVRTVAVEADGAVTDISGSVQCVSADQDVLKVSERCDHVLVNGKETRGQVDAAVNFSFQHLSGVLRVTVWAPLLPLQVWVSDTELSQIKGWRVPIGTSKRATRESEDEEEEEERRGRGCALQFQRATVRVLAQFAAQASGPWEPPHLLLGPDWQLDITQLVATFTKLEQPHVATLQDDGVLVGREVGMVTIQVLSPLSDSILAEKTVTVLDERVSVTELTVQLVAGLSVSLRPGAQHSKAVTATVMAQELLRTPKQEAVLSIWLQFSDGSTAPLDLYDPQDFALTATSLDAAVVSVVQTPWPRWPAVRAEGEGHGPLVRVDLSIAEACQKSKRRSVLAAGLAHVRVEFGGGREDEGPGEARSQAGGRWQEEPMGGSASTELEEERRKEEEKEAAAQDLAPTTAPTNTRVAETGRLDMAPAEGTRLDLTRFPGPVGAPRADAGQRGLSDLEVGMYALLGVFGLAILVFLANCATFALKYRHKQFPLEGQATAVSHSHDWVWLGHEPEHLGAPPLPSGQHTTVIDGDPGGSTGGDRPPRCSEASQKGACRQTRGAEPGPPHSPTSTSTLKKVKFTAIPPSGSILRGRAENFTWGHSNVGLDSAVPNELRLYLEEFREKV
ncbi:LOW QUALITY PROTEIN: transmembrane protein 132C-like [Suncus etruscus]|uniref:LOW QUALITY PROTEIN: transmembrane protein 132C-like n=1 Tax=Suncus etruscus TaxID=109475 RepID=UPI00210F46F7|nr:LOW QUALITY PROTEIN: transmembrane protein 132C-like [Suncus etruscus]